MVLVCVYGVKRKNKREKNRPHIYHFFGKNDCGSFPDGSQYTVELLKLLMVEEWLIENIM